jgi:hypothetical protein
MENSFNIGNIKNEDYRIENNIKNKNDKLIKSESLANRSNKFNELLNNFER